MPAIRFTGLILSDFNVSNFVNYLSNDPRAPVIDATTGEYGQVVNNLIQFGSQYSQRLPDFLCVWTLPEKVIGSFQHIVQYKRASLGAVLDEVDYFSSLILNIRNRVNYIFVPTWVYPTYDEGFGILDMKHETGIANIIMHMNLRLSKNLSEASNIYLLNTSKWVEITGKTAFEPRLWYTGKIAFGNGVFKEAVTAIKSALLGLLGYYRKIIILDLDNTLWGGVVGDDGWRNLNLGGHDPIGEAFVDFQNALKSLSNRGIILAIVSKNEERIAFEAINRHPEMVLRVEDFAGWRINWNDKAQNIIDLLSELNLGLQSAVFIDDNPAERARVREALPEVYVPNWPLNKMLYKKTLLELGCFNGAGVTTEDGERSRMYAEERKRKSLMEGTGSLEEWLKTLNILVEVDKINESNKQRTLQLLNKTNQMNLTTRRLSEKELLQWLDCGNRKLWTFRVRDRFGDSGLTGIISLDIRDDNSAQIIDFILSCRVMGRNIENLMLYIAVKHAKEAGLKKIFAKFITSEKNKPCLDFWERKSKFKFDDDTYSFEWDLQEAYPFPGDIQLVTAES